VRRAYKHPVTPQLVDGASPIERAVERFVAYFGSLRFIGWMSDVIVAWILINGFVTAMRWDPYPLILFNLAFSVQATYPRHRACCRRTALMSGTGRRPSMTTRSTRTRCPPSGRTPASPRDP
jgi:hypothetical protein